VVLVTESEDIKLVLVIDPSLPLGVIANTSALLSISIGKYLQENLGPDIPDESGLLHRGIFDRAITVLAAAPKDIARLHFAGSATDLIVLSLTTHAQKARSYGEYTRTLAATATEKLDYLGIAICGHRKHVTKLTGSLPLLR
jgi:hypothetical protein